MLTKYLSAQAHVYQNHTATQARYKYYRIERKKVWGDPLSYISVNLYNCFNTSKQSYYVRTKLPDNSLAFFKVLARPNPFNCSAE